MLKRWFPAIALAVMALGTAWLTSRLDRQEETVHAGSSRTPDVYMRNFITTTMDEAGRPRHRLAANYMAHFPDSDTHELEKPRLVMYRPPREPWHVKAERGWVSANRQVILLLGQVNIWRHDRSGAKAVEIETRDLRVLPESDYGETDKPAVITTRTSESRGVGMRANLEQGRMELLSQVETVYVEPQSPP